MNNLSEQPNKQSNLQSLEANFSLTKKELNDFKKLPSKEREKVKKTKLTELQAMSGKLDVAFQEAVRTGKLDEAQKLREQLEKEIQDLKQQIEITERPKLPEGAVEMEVIPDPEITSAETAINRLEKEGHETNDYIKDMLTKVNWNEKLKTSYEVVSLYIGALFNDSEMHTYTEIKARAKEVGLDLVPQKLVPSIRLNYKKSGVWTTVAIEAIHDLNDTLKLFACYGSGSGGSHLERNSGNDDSGWGFQSRFFFVRK